MNSNEININGTIGDDGSDEYTTLEDVQSQLDYMTGDIVVHINSLGGSVFDGIAIANALKQYSGKVSVRIEVVAASIASVIAMAGDTIAMNEYALLMIHNPWTIKTGNSDELRAAADMLDKIKEPSIAFYMQHATVSRNEIEDMMVNETWLTPDEAIKIGLADLIEKEPQKLQVAAALRDSSLLNQFQHVPSEFLNTDKSEPKQKIEYDLTKDEENKLKKLNMNASDRITQQMNESKLAVKGMTEKLVSDSFDIKADLGDTLVSNAVKADFTESIATGKITHAKAMKAYNSGNIEMLQALTASPETTGTSGGDSMLTQTMDNTIIAKRTASNPPLPYITTTTMPTLDFVPRLDFDISQFEYGKGYKRDGQIANILEMAGDKVKFGRYENHTRVPLSDTVYLGSSSNLVIETQNVLGATISLNEITNMFNETPTDELKHMSLYGSDIKSVSGTTMYDAVMNAITDIDSVFKNTLTIAMREVDFVAMRADLAKQGLCSLTATPLDLFMHPTVFVDYATTPVVGDYSYYRNNINEVTYTQDRGDDADNRQNYIDLKTYNDAYVLLPSAFRLAKVATKVDTKTVA